MIAKGNTHKSGSKLAWYLTTAKEGERVELWQLAGFAAGDIRAAFRSVHVMAEATRCEAPFFHVQVRNAEEDRPLTRAEWNRVANRIETKLGLSGQPRAIAFHIDEKTGHEHMHVAWSRIDQETMTARPLPFFKEKLKAVSRELEKELGLTRVRNDRDGPVRAPDRNEFEQARRLGVNIKEVRETIRNCWERSDCGRSFEAALAEVGLVLAKGDRRDYVVLDQEGGIHALGKRILGVSAAETRARLADLNPHRLPTVQQAREQLEGGRKKEQVWDRDRDDRAWQNAVAEAGIKHEKERPEQERIDRRNRAMDGNKTPPPGISGDREQLWRAYNTSQDAEAFQGSLTERGLHLARVTEDDVRNSRTFKFTAGLQDRYSPVLKLGEYVVLNEQGRLFRLDERTVGDSSRAVREFMKPLDGKPMESVWATRRAIEERRIQGIDPRPYRGNPSFVVNRTLREVENRATQALKMTDRVTRLAKPAEKVLSFAGDAIESLFAPKLTPEQKRDGEIAARRRAIEAEWTFDASKYVAEEAERLRQQEQERHAARERQQGRERDR